MVDATKNDPDSIKYIIKFLIGNTMLVTKELLKSRNVPDILSIPIYSEDYKNQSNYLTQQQIDNIIFPEVLSSLQQEFKSWHENVSNLYPKSMFRLTKLGVLP